MTLKNVKMSFGKFFNLFVQYCNYVLNVKDRDLYVVFVCKNLIYNELLIEWKKYGWLEVELRWICENLDFRVALLNAGLFITDKKACVDHLKNCYYLSSKSYGE